MADTLYGHHDELNIINIIVIINNRLPLTFFLFHCKFEGGEHGWIRNSTLAW